MDINRGNMDSLFEEYEVSFTDGFNSGRESSILDDIAMVMPSTTAATVHNWLNQIPQMREWIGDRLVNNIASDGMTVKNKRFEATIEMPRTDIEDDQYGLYTPLVGLMGENAAVYPDLALVAEMVSNPNWGADASPFFGTTRTYGDATISNYVTTALTETTFEAAVTAIASYQGHSGEPLNASPYALVIGPSLRTDAFDILKNDMRATAATDGVSVQNRNKGLVQPLISSRLVGDNADDWFLLAQVGGIRPVVWQDRIKAELQRQRWSIDSEHTFETDDFQIGTRSRGVAFLTLPHLAYAGLVSAA